MKYNFSTLSLKDIEGKELKGHDVHKALADGLYVGATDLDLVEIAMKIHKGEEVEIDKVETEKIKQYIKGEKCVLVAFAKKAILDYIDSVK